MVPLSASFRHFWPGFDPGAFFIPLFSNSLRHSIEEARSDQSHVDLLVDSVFRPGSISQLAIDRVLRPRYPRLMSALRPEKRPRNSLGVWFTGENIRPPLEEYDLYLSFDVDPLDGRNVYCPLILQSVDWFGRAKDIDPESPEVRRLGRLLHPHEVTKSVQEPEVFLRRSPRACAFVGNPEPFRMRALDILSRYVPVDIYGSTVGRPVRSKLSVASQYRFMICFENDVYPGYVTEKPLEAWASGCVPIWRGIDSGCVLNPDALINAADFSSLEALGERLRDVSEDYLVTMSQVPLLRYGQSEMQMLSKKIGLVLGTDWRLGGAAT